MKIISSPLTLARLSLLCLIICGALLSATYFVPDVSVSGMRFGTVNLHSITLRNGLICAALALMFICGWMLSVLINRHLIIPRRLSDESDVKEIAQADAQYVAATQQAEQMTEFARHLLRVHENEKSELALELHGGLAACFSVLTMDMSVIAAKAEQGDPALAHNLQRIVATIREAIEFKRKIVEKLRPSMLDHLGLPFVLDMYANDFVLDSGVLLKIDIDAGLGRLHPDSAIALFRIAQTALSNVLDHAQAGTVQVSLSKQSNEVVLCVGDDGVGMDPALIEKANSYGLIEMRERVGQLNGSFNIRTGGVTMKTEIEARIPFIEKESLA